MSGATSDKEYVSVQYKDAEVAAVEFFTPKANSLSSNTLERLIESVTALGSDRNVRVILLQSVGKTFCAGASLTELDALKTVPEAEEFFYRFGRLILALRDCPKIVVARVHGGVVGGGVGIVGACDYAIASEEASVRLSELSRGIGPFVVGPIIERKMGLAALTSLSFDTEWRSATWAHDRGLYARVSPAGELEGHTSAALKHFSGAKVAALLEMKRLFWAGTEGWPTLLRDRARMSASLLCGVNQTH